ncbi:MULTISPECIES: hypothetical protein [unclassified Pseudomonas]|uniref:hypothetical protein n=1 Tax=unclassified Pseudomonas TaxID=196821 RepID=UPI000B844780|nr:MULTISPECIES: hypothetical protein [unclassified Pseudomonas]
MTIAALLAPEVTSSLASVATALITSSKVAEQSHPASLTQTIDAAGSHPFSRRQAQKLTNLKQVMLQSRNCDMSAKGVGIAVGGIAVQEAGQKLAASGGLLSKALGLVMIVGGKVAQAHGAEKFDLAGRPTIALGSSPEWDCRRR